MSVELIVCVVLGVIVLILALMYYALRWRVQQRPSNAVGAGQQCADAVQTRIVNDECTVEPIDSMDARMYPCGHRWATHAHVTLYGEVLTAEGPLILEEMCGDCLRAALMDRTAFPRCAACGYAIFPVSHVAAFDPKNRELPHANVAFSAGSTYLCCTRWYCLDSGVHITGTWTQGQYETFFSGKSLLEETCSNPGHAIVLVAGPTAHDRVVK